MPPKHNSNPIGLRLDIFQQKLLSHSLDAALISKKESIYYLTGLIPQHPTEREAYLFITPTQKLLYHSPFIDIEPANSSNHLSYLAMSPVASVGQVLTESFDSVTQIGIEKNNLTVAEYERIITALPDKNLSSIDSLISDQKLIKDSAEQKLLRQAGRIARQAMSWCQQLLNQPNSIGLTELAVAQLLDAKMLELGADAPAFPTIVAFDANTAKPHHRPGPTALKPTSLILIDMGASFSQYKSDMTRTWCLGRPQPKFASVQTTVLSAYNQSLAAAAPRISAQHLDQIARHVIHHAGYADHFIHSTGHGIGIEAHELPHLSTTDLTPLEPGAVFTIEPGVYFDGQFGYRHENTFIMTDKGAVSIT